MRIFQNKFELSYQRDSYVMVSVAIGMALSLFIGRRPLFRTTINRRLTYSAVIALAVVILNRVVGQALGLGIRQSMAYDGVVMTTVLLMKAAESSGGAGISGVCSSSTVPCGKAMLFPRRPP